MLDFSSYRPADAAERLRLREAERCFHEGFAVQSGGDLEAAMRLYRRSIELRPTAEAHTFLGWAMSLRGELREAIAECLTAIEIDRDFGNPYNDIGAYLLQLGRPDEAEPWFRRAVGAPRYECYHFAHGNLGRVLEARLDLAGARDHYSIALSMQPGFETAREGLLRVSMALN